MQKIEKLKEKQRRHKQKAGVKILAGGHEDNAIEKKIGK
jgi:hypothetical protein